MGKHATGDIRNIALIGGPGTGKTTLAEAMLLASGAITRMGDVADGNTVSDYDDDEKEKQHSLRTSVLHMDTKGRHIALLDAPGYPDFRGEAVSGMAASETALLVVQAGQGVTFPIHKIWTKAGQMGRARAIVVTHIDQHEIDFPAFVEELSESLGARCLPVVLPQGSGEGLQGVSMVPLGAGAEGDLEAARDALVEAVVEVDEDAMTRFLEEDKPPEEKEAYELLTRSMVAGEVVPVLAVSSKDGKGVDELLEVVKRAFPSPETGPPYVDAEGNEIKPDGPTSAFVFKSVIDPFMGKLCHLRVVSGAIEAGKSLHSSHTDKPEKLAHLLQIQGKEHSAITEAVAGDLIAVTKIDALETGDSLAEGNLRFPPIPYPKPMASRAVEPENHADDIKLTTALRRAAGEDPTLVCERNEGTGELVVSGISLMHLEMHFKRIKEKAGVEMKVEVPRVALKETIQGPSDGHHRHKKQTGGRGQFAEVFLQVEPAERGSGLVFLDETVGGSIPRNFLPAIEKGVREVMTKGVIAGYPVVDVTVKIKDGKFHDVDSDEASFKLAGGRAFKDGFSKARPVLLEPLLDIEVAVPSRFMGAITSDMTGRRGQISGMDSLGDVQIVRARVPQREVLTYPTVLHSLTSGEGSFTAEFHDYEVVPPNVQQEIMAEYKPQDEDD